MQDLYWVGYRTGSPLVLDVSDAGSGISLVSATSSNAVYWDFGDGFKHASGWVGAGTGLLCVDPGSTGVITQSDLFGNQPSTGIANGFQALAAYDSNSDGVINSSDTNFGNLRVWIDANGNGVSDAGELHTLASLGITSINLGYSDVNYQISGNTILQQSTFTMSGDTRTIADAWFTYDASNTVYDGSTTISTDAAALPDQRGYGQLPELAIAMSQDSTLLGLVDDIADQSFSQLLDPSYHLEAKLQAILYQWAGVESVDPQLSYGYFSSHFDAQKLAFLETFVGQLLDGTGDYHAVGGARLPYFTESWDTALSFISANILAQAGFSDLMGHPVYESVGDKSYVNGDTPYDVTVQFADEAYYGTLSHLATNDIFVLNSGDAPLSSGSPTIFINETASGGGTNTLLLAHISPSDVTMSDDVYGNLYVKYTSTDTVQINGGVVYAAGITVGDYVQQIAFDNGVIWDLTGGIHLTATAGYSYVYGTHVGGDTLDAGGITSATLTAYTGDNVLIAGPGAQLYGGNDENSYVINPDSAPVSSGGATIHANTSATADHVILHSVTPADVTMFDDYSGNLMISTSNGDLATIADGSYAPYGSGITIGNVSQVVFDDSTVWDLTGVVTLTSGTGHGTLYGLSTGTNFVAGGIGGSTFEGYSVHDIFTFDSGSSPASGGGYSIQENATGGTTTAIHLQDVVSTDITMWDDTSGNLMISTSNGDLATIAGSYSSSTGVHVGNVNHITLDDSSTIGLQGGLNLTASNDGQSLYGTGHGDNMHDLGTSDTFYGIAGNNTMTGDSGTTNFLGGSGNDLMIGGSGTNNMTMGTGADEIKVESATSTNTVTGFSISNGDTIHLEDVLTGYDPLHDSLANFVQEATSGGNTTFSIDNTGSGTFTAGPLVTLNSVTGLDDIATLVANGHLIVHS